VACSGSELTSEAINPFRHSGSTPWKTDRPIARPLHTHDRKQQKNRASTGTGPQPRYEVWPLCLGSTSYKSRQD